jgi:iron only hydrogenase large subunit-like protein
MTNRFQEGRSKTWVKPTTSTAESSTTVAVYENNSNALLSMQHQAAPVPALSQQLPILSSHCPGWVCYAEKTSPQALPYLSTVKSAQQIVGSVVKSLLAASDSAGAVTRPEQSSDLTDCCIEALSSLSLDAIPCRPNVLVVSVQPCFDKKLEASRKVITPPYPHPSSPLSPLSPCPFPIGLLS